LFVSLQSLVVLSRSSVGYDWFVLAGLTLLSGSFTVKIPTIPARLSGTETFVFAAVRLYGPAAATMVVVLDSLVISLWIYRKSRKAIRVLFNLSAPTVAVWLAAQIFFAITKIRPLSEAPASMLPLLAPLALLALVYFLLNSWLIAIAVGFDQKTSPLSVWKTNFLWISLNYFSGASVAALLLPYLVAADRLAIVRVIGILLPLLVISYLTFKTALGRVEDANRHLNELNRLYMSTIETLAMAIDAKDQITHGHIRRVQTFAVGLARHMGVKDAAQIQAIEAAALLHDMGKLAVPEYILNKPGPLTAAEFDKMKLHASVGADILSAIEFPYPVVPIVRHHHENWDGSGYPDGLSGTDIPIGARILSVVDCFDALTSDRPYRPRLSDGEALKIIAERRGTMYDPLVVDTFTKVYRSITPQPTDYTVSRTGIAAIARGTGTLDTQSQSRLGDISASTEEMVLLYELARSLVAAQDLSETAEVIAKHLRRLIPATTSVFFVYDEQTDELYCAHAAGENSSHFSALRIATGQRLSGWVAANRQTIVNSDATLDLGEVARALQPPLRSCLSTPLTVAKELVGVLTLYSTQANAFNDEHLRLIEAIARQVAQPLRNGVMFQRGTTHDSADKSSNGSPESAVASYLKRVSNCSLTCVSVQMQGNVDALIEEVVLGLKACVGRRDDYLIARLDDQRVVILSPHFVETSDDAASVIRSYLWHLIVSYARLGDGSISVGSAKAPDEGHSLSQLLEIAEGRRSAISLNALPRPSIH
jgi:putative nucleotidyltransferase with HDIG domain